MTKSPYAATLKADYSAARTSVSQAQLRAWVCSLLGHADRIPTAQVARTNYPGQSSILDYIKRGATDPGTSTGWLDDFATTGYADQLFSIGSSAASTNVLRQSIQLLIGRRAAFNVPFLTDTVGAGFVGEADPLPVKQLNIAAGTTIKLKTFGVIVPFTRRVLEHSLPAIEQVVRTSVLNSTESALDGVMFGSAAADTVSPAGLLNNANAALPATAAGPTAHLEDVAKLVGAVANLSLNSTVILVANHGQAARLKLEPAVVMQYPIYGTSALPVRSVIAIAANHLISASEPAASFSVTEEALLHMEDTSPEQIGTAGSPPTVAAPTRSLW